MAGVDRPVAVGGGAGQSRDQCAGYHAGRRLVDDQIANTHLDADYAVLDPEAAVGDYAMATVLDTGSEIAPELLDRET
jgi:hypothetical protein